jgi:hypothetical protein
MQPSPNLTPYEQDMLKAARTTARSTKFMAIVLAISIAVAVIIGLYIGSKVGSTPTIDPSCVSQGGTIPGC